MLLKGLYKYIDSWGKLKHNQLNLVKTIVNEIEDLKQKIFTVVKIWKLFLMQIIDMEKEFGKILRQKPQGNLAIYMFEAIQYCQQMCLKIFEIFVLKYISLNLSVFLLHQDQHSKKSLKGQKKVRTINQHQYIANGRKSY